MKKLFCAILALCLSSALVLSAFAETVVTAGGITARFSDVFTVFTKDNIEDKADRAAELSEDFSELKGKLSKDYLFYAVAPDMGWTVFMTAGETDVSKAIVDLADYSDGQTAEQALIGGIKDRASEVKEIRKGAALFLKLTFKKEQDAGGANGQIGSGGQSGTADGGNTGSISGGTPGSSADGTSGSGTGDQSAASQGAASQSAGTAGASLSTAAGTDNRIMYVTVMNGKVYTLVFIEQSAELSKNASDSAEYIFNSLEYTVDSEVARVKEHKKTTFNILLAVCSPLAAVAVFFIIRSIKRDVERAKQEQSLRNNMRKKPRR